MNLLRSGENICNHKISFPIAAGLNDIIKLRFKKYTAETQVYFAVGQSYESASGQLITDLSELEVLKVGFPNSIYLTIMHPEERLINNGVNSDDDDDGLFAFEFWYKD